MFETMNNKPEPFAWVEWMIQEREKQGMSQADLARAAEVSRTTISDYERRIRVKPDIEVLWRVSIALGYPDDYLPRLAGFLPPKKANDPWAEKMANLLSQLLPSSRNFIEDTIASILKREKAETKKATTNTRTAPQTRK